MKLLVTGASGFLGGAVARAAEKAGHEVFSTVRKDFDSADAIASKLDSTEPEIVLHFAGSASVAASFSDPLSDFHASTALAARLLEGVRKSRVRPFITLASSAAVYGSPNELPTPETARLQPESPYGFHKLLLEKIGEEYAQCFGLSVTALRYFSIFGPRQRRLLVWEIYDQLRRGDSILTLKGTGDEERDFLGEAEAANVSVALAEALAADPASKFRTLNVASGKSATVREVVEIVQRCMSRKGEVAFEGRALPGNPARWQASIAEVRRLLPDWKAALIAESLADCVHAWADAEETKAVLS